MFGVNFLSRSDIANYNIHFDIISNLLSSVPYVIMIGDYNILKLHWLPSLIGFSLNLLNLSLT